VNQYTQDQLNKSENIMQHKNVPFTQAFVDKLSANELNSFLSAYHSALTSKKAFPPLQGNKPLHLVAELLSFNSIEQLMAAMEHSSTLVSEKASSELIFALSREDELPLVRTYNNEEDAFAYIRVLLQEALNTHEIHVQDIVNRCGVFDSVFDEDLDSPWMRDSSDSARLYLASQALSAEELNEIYQAITHGREGQFTLVNAADPGVRRFKDADEKGNTQFCLTYRVDEQVKASVEVVLHGAISEGQCQLLSSRLTAQGQFIAHEVGLPTPSTSIFSERRPDELDHPYTDIIEFTQGHPVESARFHTEKTATVDLHIDELLARLAQAPFSEDNEVRRLDFD
jgi:hypothetical protein